MTLFIFVDPKTRSVVGTFGLIPGEHFVHIGRVREGIAGRGFWAMDSEGQPLEAFRSSKAAQHWISERYEQSATQ